MAPRGKIIALIKPQFEAGKRETVDAIIEELRHTTVAERSGRAQDEGRGMELLRKDGYM